ncbi:RES family NAD+ phosphorylase [Gloeocapsopsis dulcis]|uniref:RES domain-containing protein n=1 Tax=Gloeocapsopsis dulcis AAB1 = 1H9 TaxID=1433147 RepID=A0A6N8G2D8_9CHRO|nr:RES family NAD+ phosphorylase [Gloeocapsopsis dulcis]MUL39269.1 hypothetical protein [Gloeocapsopsis dulcis AAB1 = 1H9]WNN92331.1 RES family NAD+ phosphorylase [Gloeocapsopsis dulcis]
MASKEPLEEPLAPHPEPLPNFGSRLLPVVESNDPWYRLNPVRYESALYFDRSGKGRFDAPEQGSSILYVGADEYAAFIECFGRAHGARGVAELALKERNLVRIRSARPLILADLTGSGLVKLGADSRIASGPYLMARKWAQAIWEHKSAVDGVRYHSRHDDTRICCGLFDRTRSLLREENLGNLVEQHPVLLAQILAHYDYGLL